MSIKEQLREQLGAAVLLTIQEGNIDDGKLALKLAVDSTQVKFILEGLENGDLNLSTTIYCAEILLGDSPLRLEFHEALRP